MKAVGMFIFCGSATIGAEMAGFEIDRVLEMVDEMDQLNGYHFAKNRKDIPMIKPSEWEKEAGYLPKLKAQDLDLMYSNCPCSSLSQINRNAAVDGKNNVQFYRVFNALKTVQPKAFIIENAPTLIKLGYPILMDMYKELGDLYKFTIIRDEAGNHNVAMRRQRTLVVGWRKDVFDNKIPLVHMNLMPTTSQKDIIGDLYDVPVGDPSVNNHEFVPGRDWANYDKLLEHVKPGETLIDALIRDWSNLKKEVTDDNYFRQVERCKAKREAGGRIWNKAPERKPENDVAPSLSSVAHYAHPVHNRQYTIREYARLMGYPDDFVLNPNEGKTPIVQCIAQGVPARFIEYIASEVKAALEGKRDYVDGSALKNMCFQYHTHKVAKAFDGQELANIKGFDFKPGDKTFFKLEK